MNVWTYLTSWLLEPKLERKQVQMLGQMQELKLVQMPERMRRWLLELKLERKLVRMQRRNRRSYLRLHPYSLRA